MPDEGVSSSTSMPNWPFTGSNPRIPMHTLPSVPSSQKAASSASGTRALAVMLNGDAIDNAPEMRLDMLYDSWKKAPENLRQLPTLSSSAEMTESGDHHDNVKEPMHFASLPMLEQHQIRLEDGTVGTYFALPRDSATESQVGHEKITSLYDSLSFPELTQDGVAATNAQEQRIEGVFHALLRPHNELGHVNGISHTEDDLYEKRLMRWERAGHTQFERRLQRELEDSFHAIEDANGACGERSGSSALPLKSHAGAREGAHLHNPRDHSALHGNVHAEIEELSEHVYMAFMNYAKVLNEFPEERTKLEKQGKGGTLLCLTCNRFSKPYADTHSLVMHTFMSRKRGLRAEHLGLRKAICTVMGWSTTLEPSIGKSYQHITSEEAKMNKEDLILWPPALVIHNALARECSDFQARDAAELAVKDLFKEAGLSSSGIEVVVGNIGSLLVEYSASSSCLLEAERLHLHLAAKGCGRDAWLHKSAAGQQESMPKDRRMLYGYLGCAHDLNLVDRDFRRRCQVLSRKKVPSVDFVA